MKLAVAFVLISGLYLLSTVQLEEPKPEITTNLSENLNGIPQDSNKSERGGLEEQTEKGDCECAVFGTETPVEQKPLLSKTTVKVYCNAEGKKQCQELCIVLALAARESGDVALCQFLDHVEKLQPSIFAKVCNESTYTFTGVTSPKTYCCHEGKPLVCKQTEADKGV